MKTELDLKMDAVMAAMTAEGGPLALTEIERFGRKLPVIAAAPPTLGAYVAHFCNEHQATEFLVAGDERLTFGAVYAAATQVAAALVGGFGVKKGDRVGIAARNSPAWITLYFGILLAGGVATLLNGWWQADEFREAIEDVDCSLVFADGPRAARLATIAGLRAQVVTFDDTLPLAGALAGVTTRDVGALPAIGPDDHATILFTSGSTGRSKGALSTHRQVVQGVFNYLSSAMMMLAIATQDGEVSTLQPSTLLNVPLFHVTAEVPVMLMSLATGQRGEVCIRSVANFELYWGRPDATAEAFTADGYFRTGDIGYLDEDGYLFIVDRKKDIIIRGGENISCQEVEAALYEHPAVAEAAVFGLADEKFGEVPGAVVHPAEGASLSPEELTDFLLKHIAAFKVPARIWIVADPLPRLGTEKIDKVSLRAKYRALVAA